MPVSEDGVPYGSIDVNELDSVEPKTDEAKAALDAVKARIQEGQEQAAADAAKQAEVSAAQDQTVDEPVKDDQGKPEEAKPVEQSEGQASRVPGRQGRRG